MGNEMAQALLESSKDTETVKSTQNTEQANNKVAFQSIIDLIWCKNSGLSFSEQNQQTAKFNER